MICFLFLPYLKNVNARVGHFLMLNVFEKMKKFLSLVHSPSLVYYNIKYVLCACVTEE